jgi:hypothetical protein
LEAISQCDEKTIWLAIDKLFEIVSGITQMQPVALLPCLGFDPKNQSHDSLQSLFGVMRSVTMLHNLGFIDITPLPPRQDRKEADLLAKRQDDLFAVEVFRANEDRWRYPSGL